MSRLISIAVHACRVRANFGEGPVAVVIQQEESVLGLSSRAMSAGWGRLRVSHVLTLKCVPAALSDP